MVFVIWLDGLVCLGEVRGEVSLECHSSNKIPLERERGQRRERIGWVCEFVLIHVFFV